MARKIRKPITVNPETSAKFGAKFTDRVTRGLANGVGSVVGLTLGAAWGIATGVGHVVGDALEKLDITEEDETETPVAVSPAPPEAVEMTQSEIDQMVARAVQAGVAQALEQLKPAKKAAAPASPEA